MYLQTIRHLVQNASNIIYDFLISKYIACTRLYTKGSYSIQINLCVYMCCRYYRCFSVNDFFSSTTLLYYRTMDPTTIDPTKKFVYQALVLYT